MAHPGGRPLKYEDKEKRKTWFQIVMDRVGQCDISKYSLPENDGKDFCVNQFEFAKMKREFKNEKALSVPKEQC